MSHDTTDGPIADEPDSGSAWDAGLRAAFGPATTVTRWEGGAVLEAIEKETGLSSRILLREEPHEPAELIRPRSPDRTAETVAPRKYQVAGEIARGGVGVVLKGRDLDLGRDVALKTLRAEHATNPDLLRRFVEEAQIGGQLQHPGVLPVYEMGLDPAHRPFFSMKLVRGRTLAAELQGRSHPGHDLRRFLGIFEQVCQTMAYAHARGVVHRDLKPSNVMVGGYGEVHVVDWGLAKVLTQGGVADEFDSRVPPVRDEAVTTIRSGSAQGRSEVGSVLGTPSYMAPEQARGEIDAVDERADVFALGGILCEILTGHPPYEGSRADVLAQATEGRLETAFDRLDRCGADADLIGIARRCLAPEARHRPREASLVARDMTAYLTSVEERARAAELAAAEARARVSAERKTRRVREALGVTILLALVVVGGSLVLAANSRLQAERERRARLESALSIFLALDGKGRWILAQAADVSDTEAGRWIQLIRLTREAAERAAADAPDAAARRRADDLLTSLRAQERELQVKAEREEARRQATEPR